MKLHHVVAGLAFTLSLSAQAVVTSTFDTDAEGWSGLTARPAENAAPIHNAGPFGAYSVTGGNPGGYFRLADPDDQDTFFIAPTKFLGNQSSAVGGTLSYDLFTDATTNYAGPNVVLQGGGLTLVYVLTTQPAVQNSWVNVSVAFTPSAAWHLGSAGGGAVSAADFQTALGNLSRLWISAETHSPVEEISGLDNVRLVPAVPEPATAALMLLGVAAVAGLQSRRRAAAG